MPTCQPPATATRRSAWPSSPAICRVALPRFFALSLAGFALNETGYALLLRWTALPYDLALACVLLAVAVMTYLLGSSWAFRRTPAR